MAGSVSRFVLSPGGELCCFGISGRRGIRFDQLRKPPSARHPGHRKSRFARLSRSHSLRSRDARCALRSAFGLAAVLVPKDSLRSSFDVRLAPLGSPSPGDSRPPGEGSSPEQTGAARQRPAPFDVPEDRRSSVAREIEDFAHPHPPHLGPPQPPALLTQSLSLPRYAARPSHATRLLRSRETRASAPPPRFRQIRPTLWVGLRKGPTARRFRRRKHRSERSERGAQRAYTVEREGASERCVCVCVLPQPTPPSAHH